MKETLFQAGLAIRFPAMTMEQMTANAHAVGWELHYTPLASRLYRAQPSVVHTANLQLGFTRYEGGAEIRGQIPGNTVLLCFVVDDKPICNFHNRRLEPHEVFVADDRDEIDFLHNGACTIVTLTLARGLFETLYAQWFAQEWQGGRLRLGKAGCEAFLGDIKEWIGHFFDPACRLCEREIFLRAEEEILSRFFERLAWEGRVNERVETLRKARALLREHAHTYYTVTQLAEELGTTPRNLQYLFKRHLGISPKSYWMGLKFKAVREELKNVKDEINIGELALRHGFYHAGHFSAVYKRYFGESPSQTLSLSHF